MDLLSYLWLIRKNWPFIAGSPALSVMTALGEVGDERRARRHPLIVRPGSPSTRVGRLRLSDMNCSSWRLSRSPGPWW